MSESYLEVIKNAFACNKEIFNVDENHSVNKLAEMVNSSCPDAKLIREKVVDQILIKFHQIKFLIRLDLRQKKQFLMQLMIH